MLVWVAIHRGVQELAGAKVQWPDRTAEQRACARMPAHKSELAAAPAAMRNKSLRGEEERGYGGALAHNATKR
jgi:hypothetical protein